MKGLAERATSLISAGGSQACLHQWAEFKISILPVPSIKSPGACQHRIASGGGGGASSARTGGTTEHFLTGLFMQLCRGLSLSFFHP